MGSGTHLCPGCGFASKRGALPIIWPSNRFGRQVYCSVSCFENVSGMTLPEPMRTMHIETESGR